MTQFFSLADLGLVASTGQALQQWLTSMQAQFPGYNPSEANLEYVLAQIDASLAASLGQLASSGGNELFRTYGTKLLQLPYQNGTSASAVVTITAVDTAGYTLPAGTQLTLKLNGAPLGFLTVSDLTIAAGASSGNVTVSAVQTGVAFNGASSPAQMVAQIAWVSSVSVVSSASGGVDQEDDDHYLNRLAADLQLLAPRPIIGSDFAAMALNFTPAVGTDQQTVGRATAIDGYDPTGNTYNNQREVTVCVTDATGNPLNSDTMYGIGGTSSNIITLPASWGVAGWLRSLRELNFIVNVVPPNYTTVYVAVAVHPATGYTGATVAQNVQTALLNYLTPANFGLPTNAQAGWNNNQTIYRSKVEAVISNASGVDYIRTGSLAIDVNPSPTNTTADLTLPGPFPLPVTSVTSIPLAAITLI